jgi:adenylate kinase
MSLQNSTLEQLQTELKRREACLTMPKNNLILLGPPGAGKGTQSNYLIQNFCYCQIATGDLLRENIAKKTEVGMTAKAYMDKGALVPDEVVNTLILNAINSPACERGTIFDGYPRNQAQAENLDNLLGTVGRKLDLVIELKVDEEALAERITGRRIHQESGRSYHVKFNPPKVDGRDDVTGEPLYQRPDDKVETLKARLDVYNQKTAPIASYYSRKNILKSVDAMQKINVIQNQISSVLKH